MNEKITTYLTFAVVLALIVRQAPQVTRGIVAFSTGVADIAGGVLGGIAPER